MPDSTNNRPTQTAEHSEAWERGYHAGKNGYGMSIVGVVSADDWSDFDAGFLKGNEDRGQEVEDGNRS